MIGKPMAPKSVFFENDRNSLFLEAGKTDFIEQVYSQIDDACAPALEKLRNLDGREISTDILLGVKHFINTLFWRTPATDLTVDSFIDSLSKEELKFSLTDKEGNPAPEEVFNAWLKDPDFRKAYRGSLGLINYRIIKNEEVHHWKFYFSQTEGFHVTGDNPIIFKDASATHPEDTDFIIPLASGNLLVRNKGKRVEMIQPETIMKIHLLIALQSSRYSCCVNRDYLRFLNVVKTNFRGNDVERIKDEVFMALSN